MCVSWVACHPVFIKPGIGEARTTAVQSRTVLWGQYMNLVHPPKSSSIPVTYIYIDVPISMILRLNKEKRNMSAKQGIHNCS